jgi:hypothetical protein
MMFLMIILEFKIKLILEVNSKKRDMQKPYGNLLLKLLKDKENRINLCMFQWNKNLLI